MFQHLHSRNGRNKESRIKRVLQAALLLAVVIWLLHHVIKREDSGSEEIKLNIEDVIGRKGKAGSENVIILDGSKENFEMYETSETEDNNGDASHIPEKDEDSQDKRHEDSQELAVDDGKSETQEEQVSNKDNDPVVNEVGPEEVKSSGVDDDHERILKLPSERNSETFSDQNEDESRKDEQNELVTVNEIKNATEEVITSDQETVLSSNNQLDGGEESEVEKVAIDSQGATEHDNVNVGEQNEVEKVSTDSHDATERETVNGGEVSMEDSTNNANSDDQHPLLPNEETTEISNNNEGSGNADFNSENDIATDLETSDHHVAETLNSDLKTEEEVINQLDSTENEVPKREAIESTSLSDSTDDKPSVEEDANTKFDEDLMKTSLADSKLENTELFGNTENAEEESVESHGDDASSAENTTSNDVDTARMVTETNTDSTESHSDGSSGDNSSTETSEEMKNTEDGSKPNEETPNTESTESRGENDSEGDNSNIVSEDLKTEENLNTEISAE